MALTGVAKQDKKSSPHRPAERNIEPPPDVQSIAPREAGDGSTRTGLSSLPNVFARSPLGNQGCVLDGHSISLISQPAGPINIAGTGIVLELVVWPRFYVAEALMKYSSNDGPTTRMQSGRTSRQFTDRT